MTIKLTEGNYENGDLKGSETQEEYKLFLRQKEGEAHKLTSIVNKLTEVENIYNSAQTDSIEKITLEETLNRLRTEMDKINLQITDITYRYFAQHPDSYITAYLLFYLNDRPSTKFYEQAYAKFSDKIKNSRYGKYISDDIKRRLLVEVGALSPDFTALDIDGNKITLSALRGKTVLLDFWASWCIPCREGIPELKKFYEQYYPAGFEIITISVDRRIGDWKKGVADEKIANFYNVHVNEEITKGYENIFLPIPSQILINGEGTIVWKKTSNKVTDEKSLGNQLAEIFMK